MKKNIIIFILVLVIIVEYFILIINKGKMYQIKNEMQVTIDNLNTKIEYLKTKQINPEIKNINNIKETIILHDDLNLQISNFLLNSENKSISMDMFFSSNNKDIQSVTYNLLIYDKNINIIGEHANLFRFEQLQKLFQDNNMEYNDSKVLVNTRKHKIDSRDLQKYKISYNGSFISSDLLDLSQIKIRLSDIKYKLYSGEEYNIIDKIFDISVNGNEYN